MERSFKAEDVSAPCHLGWLFEQVRPPSQPPALLYLLGISLSLCSTLKRWFAEGPPVRKWALGRNLGAH